MNSPSLRGTGVGIALVAIAAFSLGSCADDLQANRIADACGEWLKVMDETRGLTVSPTKEQAEALRQATTAVAALGDFDTVTFPAVAATQGLIGNLHRRPGAPTLRETESTAVAIMEITEACGAAVDE